MDVVTQNLPQTSATPTGADNAKTLVVPALLTFSCGMLVVVGNLMIGGFGILLGIIGAIFGVVWWRSVNGTVVPVPVKKSSLISLIVVSIVLFGFGFLVA